ncbi:hypothetical protein V5739_03595 [Salinimicrobium sp. TIG7-5_MAKvit]|uniref:hypothetical protein n=1 Tax=Salinimicrobium sp. TIG7-5_MAKvit TaxID=3121289 RepID=UPI003C6E76DE
MENLKSENYSEYLNSWISKNEIKLPKIAKAINCSVPTLNRLLEKQNYPTDEMIRQTGIMMTVGFPKYSKMSDAEKEHFSEKLGSISGAGLGFASVSAVVGGLGTAGLSGAGIMSGLAAAGGIIGGGAAAGIAVVAAVPILTGIAGYGIVKGVKHLTYNYKSKIEKIDSRWETSR